VPAEQVAETILMSVTLNSLSPDIEAEADGEDADGALALADAPALSEPLTST